MNTIDIELDGQLYTCRGAFSLMCGGFTDIYDEGIWLGELHGTTPPDPEDEESLAAFVSDVRYWLEDYCQL